MDTLTREQRSGVMRRVKGKDTGPEREARRLIHAMGYRYRLHVRALPGAPDLVFPSRKKVIFIHGCFWHRHACRKGRSTPSSRTDFWSAKFESNVQRDRRVRRRLRRLGWDVLVIWECQMKRLEALQDRVRSFLGKRGNQMR